MTGRRIVRAMLVVGVWTIALGAMPAARASGGGGCGAPVTDAAGTTVAIDQFCFSPTILRAEPGAVVTFENLDPVTHNVLGAHGAWGTWDPMRRNRELAFRFAEAGVFPYVCAYHPGMVGVVVVGDGIGGAISTTTEDGPVIPVSARELAKLGTSPVAISAPVEGPAEGAGPWAAVAVAAVATITLATVVLMVRRSRRRSIA